MLTGLAKTSRGRELEMKAYSQVIVEQVKREYLAKSEKLIRYFRIERIPLSDNWKVDRVAQTASTKKVETLPWEITTRAIDTPTIGAEVLEVGKDTPKWAGDITKYLEIRNLPNN